MNNEHTEPDYTRIVWDDDTPHEYDTRRLLAAAKDIITDIDYEESWEAVSENLAIMFSTMPNAVRLQTCLYALRVLHKRKHPAEVAKINS